MHCVGRRFSAEDELDGKREYLSFSDIEPLNLKHTIAACKDVSSLETVSVMDRQECFIFFLFGVNRLCYLKQSNKCIIYFNKKTVHMFENFFTFSQ